MDHKISERKGQVIEINWKIIQLDITENFIVTNYEYELLCATDGKFGLNEIPESCSKIA